jgi:hypothetical protein
MLLALVILVGTPQGWDTVEHAQEVQVLRVVDGVASQPFVPVVDLKPTDIVKACDAPLEIGSFISCPESGRTPPARKDVWRRWADVLPTAPIPGTDLGAVRVRWSVPGPIRFADDDSVVPEGTPIYMRIYEGTTLIASVPWTPEVSVVRAYPQDETRCFSAGLWVDLDRNGRIDVGSAGSEESRTRNETCSMAKPLPVEGPSKTPRSPPAPIIEALQPGETPPP